MLEEILRIYENKVTLGRVDNAGYLVINLEGQDLSFKVEDFSQEELALLKLLADKETDEKATYPRVSDKEWDEYLRHSKEMPSVGFSYGRFLYLKLSQPISAFSYNTWQETFRQALPMTKVIVFTESSFLYVLFEDTQEVIIDIAEINEVFSALAQDFDVTVQAVLGFRYNVTDNLKEFFNRELGIVKAFINKYHSEQVLPLSQLLLKVYGENLYKDQEYLKNLRQHILNNSSYQATIEALFESQGNISQTAERLFVHRHTLTNRLNKFTKETGFNLQLLPDLVLCYLIL